MTSPIDDLLSRARQIHQPYTQADIDAAESRLAARAASAFLHELEEGGPQTARTPRQTPSERKAPSEESTAAQDLQTLCETVVTHTGALADLKLFLARALPEPSGARVLGCMLQLSEREESARFWWQYAAGAGDTAATYCLYLHHRALGEYGEADWWHTQADIVTSQDTGDDQVALAPTTSLRILRALKIDTPGVPDCVSAVLDYVPVAVTYVDDDLDLPLPDPDFTDHIRTLTAAAPADPTRGPRPAPLPKRKIPRRSTCRTRAGWP
ncbi:hypothetical protein [Streptomyces sp. NPDC051219]|uniref:hypothetical protein n=1 Tax=Streptomyces sp. NPDC051219 TaxID=3155283 RepID=UPI00343F9165